MNFKDIIQNKIKFNDRYLITSLSISFLKYYLFWVGSCEIFHGFVICKRYLIELRSVDFVYELHFVKEMTSH